MRDKIARYARVFQFCAGPQRMMFYACARHRRDIEAEAPSDVFLIIEGEAVQDVDEEYGLSCDYCRGEDGP